MIYAAPKRSNLSRFVAAGSVAGLLSAALNLVYFAGYGALRGVHWREPTLASIGLSSLFPTVLAALGYFALSRFTSKATAVFVAVTAFITLASFESMLRNTLPDGTLKPGCFDLLVMPMHVVVGLSAVLLIPRLVVARS